MTEVSSDNTNNSNTRLKKDIDSSQDSHLSNVTIISVDSNGSSIPRQQQRPQPQDAFLPAPNPVITTTSSLLPGSSSSGRSGANIAPPLVAVVRPTIQEEGEETEKEAIGAAAPAPSTPTPRTHPPAPPRLIFANPPPEEPPHHPHSSSYLPASGNSTPYVASNLAGLHSNNNNSSLSHSHHPLPDLRLQTNVVMTSTTSGNNAKSIPVPTSTRPSAAALSRSNSFQSSLSPNSAAGSPSIGGFLSEITPLPSPVITADSPGPWRLFRNGSISSRPTSRGSIASLSINEQTDYVGSEPTPAGVGRSPSKRKLYQGLNHIETPHEYRIHPATARSVSEQANNFKLDVPGVSRQSQTEESINEKPEAKEVPFKREEHLAGKHGNKRTGSTADLQVPSITDGISDNTIPEEGITKEIFTATTYPGNNIRRWKSVRLLGQGTFSKVMLATLELTKNVNSEADLDRSKLVAVKIVENTAAGGASKARIESSLKRELDILKSIKHPSLVHLKAQSIERKRALLVLGYCAGGDLFDLATTYPKLLTPKFVRRIFAELVGAVRYLHISGIVHRDIKLENVLINFTAEELTENGEDIITSNRSITTLTDLGLSRRIDFDEPLLTTRCGSEDYAAPELLLGQPYDGRQTDAWALGVLLYAICESRLPFDPVPGANEHKMRSRTAHRIARCDWKWFKLADTPPPVREEDASGEVRVPYDAEWNPAKEVVDGLLRRVKKRVPLEEVEQLEWVKGAITTPLEDPPSTEEMEEDDEN
ncbi:hypothetical protein ABW19_dt0206776 [Dactylella cylindrospora]|nr:hypothetical protein ABW19_dt0206776 [Dactylella cylindrospora]